MVGIGIKDIIIHIKELGSQDHKNGIGGKIIHGMPVGGLKNQAFVGFVEYVFGFGDTVVVVDMAGPAQADGGLDGFFVAVTAANGTVYPIDIKNAIDAERDGFFNNSQIASFIGKGF